MASSRSQVVTLYRMLMRESSKFPSYNYRTYALRRVRSRFRENMKEENQKKLDDLLNQARENLASIRRQVAIGKLYGAKKTMVEDKGSHWPPPQHLH